jgi:DNA-binding transcriptional MerR regulator
VRYLKTSEAAAILNVSPNTLRAWERRFGFPKPQRSQGRHRMFTHGEILALRDALHDGLSISSAVSRAREGLVADGDALLSALAGYERERADAAMEAALALRSLERAVDELLLPTLEEVARRHGLESAAWAFAAGWGSDWLRRARRLTPPPIRPAQILVADATRDELDPDAPAVRALELFAARAGFHVMALSARGVYGLSDVLIAHTPDLIILAGAHLGDDAVARWAYAARAARPTSAIATFRRVERRSGLRATSALPSAPGLALRRVVELLEAESGAGAVAATGAAAAAAAAAARARREQARRASA